MVRGDRFRRTSEGGLKNNWFRRAGGQAQPGPRSNRLFLRDALSPQIQQVNQKPQTSEGHKFYSTGKTVGSDPHHKRSSDLPIGNRNSWPQAEEEAKKPTRPAPEPIEVIISDGEDKINQPASDAALALEHERTLREWKEENAKKIFEQDLESNTRKRQAEEAHLKWKLEREAKAIERKLELEARAHEKKVEMALHTEALQLLMEKGACYLTKEQVVSVQEGYLELLGWDAAGRRLSGNQALRTEEPTVKEEEEEDESVIREEPSCETDPAPSLQAPPPAATTPNPIKAEQESDIKEPSSCQIAPPPAASTPNIGAPPQDQDSSLACYRSSSAAERVKMKKRRRSRRDLPGGEVCSWRVGIRGADGFCRFGRIHHYDDMNGLHLVHYDNNGGEEWVDLNQVDFEWEGQSRAALQASSHLLNG